MMSSRSLPELRNLVAWRHVANVDWLARPERDDMDRHGNLWNWSGSQIEVCRKNTVPYGTQKSRGLKHSMTLKTDAPDLTDQLFGISHNMCFLGKLIAWHGMACGPFTVLVRWFSIGKLSRNKLGSAANAEMKQNTWHFGVLSDEVWADWTLGIFGSARLPCSGLSLSMGF